MNRIDYKLSDYLMICLDLHEFIGDTNVSPDGLNQLGETFLSNHMGKKSSPFTCTTVSWEKAYLTILT